MTWPDHNNGRTKMRKRKRWGGKSERCVSVDRNGNSLFFLYLSIYLSIYLTSKNCLPILSPFSIFSLVSILYPHHNFLPIFNPIFFLFSAQFSSYSHPIFFIFSPNFLFSAQFPFYSQANSFISVCKSPVTASPACNTCNDETVYTWCYYVENGVIKRIAW